MKKTEISADYGRRFGAGAEWMRRCAATLCRSGGYGIGSLQRAFFHRSKKSGSHHPAAMARFYRTGSGHAGNTDRNIQPNDGEQQRISVQLTGYDGIQGVNDAVKDALQQEMEKTDDLVRLPDLFFAWDDTAYRLDQLNLAMHLDEFLSSEQQEAFLECVQAEMYPGDSDSMTLFPIGLDTTILMYRQDLWETFSSTLVSEDAQEQQPELTEEPADLERPAESLLSTWEGIGETALKYRQWYQTQQQTEQEESRNQGRTPPVPSPLTKPFPAFLSPTVGGSCFSPGTAVWARRCLPPTSKPSALILRGSGFGSSGISGIPAPSRDVSAGRIVSPLSPRKT